MIAKENGHVSAIAQAHWAAVGDHVGDLPELREIQTPDPNRLAANTVLVNIIYSGVCHSDVVLSSGKGTHKPVEPVISGHEGVGRVVAVGQITGTTPVPKIGARVGVKFVMDTCGQCDACLDRDEDSCENKTICSVMTQGTFQQYIVAPITQLVPIPDDVPFEQAAPILCAGLTTFKSLLNAQVKIGDWVVIPGAGGGLGHLAVQKNVNVLRYALALNLRVVAIDTGADKKALMESYGVQGWLDFREEPDLVAAVRRVVGGSPRAAIVTAGVIPPYEQALQYLGQRGTLVCVGLPVGDSLPIQPARMVVENARVVGSSGGSRSELKAALDLVAMGKVKVEVQVRPFREIRKVYEELHSGKVKGRIVMDLSQV